MVSKIPCTKCGEPILAETAAKTGGLCMPCKNGTREAMQKSLRLQQERREQEKKAQLARAPLDALRKSGHKMQFKHYSGLEEPAYEIFLAAVDMVFDRGNSRDEHLERLSPECRLVYLLWCFEGEVDNGGFDQLFTNTLGNYWLEILHGLEVVGATKSRALLQQALSWFPGSAPSADRQQRRGQHEAFAEDAAYQAHLERLDDAFYQYEDDLAALIDAYVRRHGDAWLAAVHGR